MGSETEKPTTEKLADIEFLPPIGYEKVVTYAQRELSLLQPIYAELVQTRVSLYGSASDFDTTHSIREQSYDDASYNVSRYKKELRLRHGGAEFHEESENLDTVTGDTPELIQRKQQYRQAILKAMQHLSGYAYDYLPGTSPDPLDQRLGMRESILSPDTPIIAETVVVPAAAGMSNYMRIQDTIRNIKSGAVKTDSIVISTGERTVPPREYAAMATNGFQAGSTEYESATAALEDLLGVSFDNSPIKSLPANYGVATPDTKYKELSTTIGDQDVSIIILEAAYDRSRRHNETGKVPDRANTDETFYATLPFLKQGEGTVLIESHDVWIPYQEVIGNRVFGLFGNKDVIATGPYKDTRIAYDTDGTITVTAAQAVVDEIGKRVDDLTKLLVEAENAKSPEIALLGRLVKPIPDMEPLLALKEDYRSYPIDTHSSPEISNEPLVSLAHYGIAGQSYYSRPNATTPDGLPGVEPTVCLRQSIAETLSLLNKKLASPLIYDFFGGEVELYVEEGVRSKETQEYLWEEAVPNLIKNQNPRFTQEEIDARKKDIIAKPRQDTDSPSPHETGAAFDVILRYKQNSIGYIEGSEVPMGHSDGDTSATIAPDYYEHNSLPDTVDPRVRNFRRAFYNIMTGEAFSMPTGFIVNPTEFWHWSRHDQLAAKLSKQRAALYGLPDNEVQ